MSELMTGAYAGTPSINPNTGGAIHRDLYKHGGDKDALAKSEAKQARGMGLSFFVFFSLILGGISMGWNGLFHPGLMTPMELGINGNTEQTVEITNASLLEVVWDDDQTTTPGSMIKVGEATANGKVGISLLINNAWAGRLVDDARQSAKPTHVRFSAEGMALYKISGDEAAPVVPGPRYAWVEAKLLHAIPTRWIVLMGIAFGGLGLLAPALLVPFHRFWMGVIAEKMGWFMTRLILGLFFYVAVTPYSVLVRIFASDPLHLEKRPTGESYWLKRDAQRDRKHFERTF